MEARLPLAVWNDVTADARKAGLQQDGSRLAPGGSVFTAAVGPWPSLMQAATVLHYKAGSLVSCISAETVAMR